MGFQLAGLCAAQERKRDEIFDKWENQARPQTEPRDRDHGKSRKADPDSGAVLGPSHVCPGRTEMVRCTLCGQGRAFCVVVVVKTLTFGFCERNHVREPSLHPNTQARGTEGCRSSWRGVQGYRKRYAHV